MLNNFFHNIKRLKNGYYVIFYDYYFMYTQAYSLALWLDPFVKWYCFVLVMCEIWYFYVQFTCL